MSDLPEDRLHQAPPFTYRALDRKRQEKGVKEIRRPLHMHGIEGHTPRDNNGTQLDDESLSTFMCEAEAIINSRPLTVDGLRDPDSLAPLTPNHLLTMKSKIVLPPPGKFQDADKYSRKRWRRVQHLANEFWCRWKKEFLQSLQLRQKWLKPQRDLRSNDIVLIKDDCLARNHWQLARVTKTNRDEDGHVRTVQLLLSDPNITSKGVRTKPVRLLERPIHKLVLLMTSSEAEEQEPGCIPTKEP
ncbi:hypothetical protein ACROYT_G014351 [Oculina patagonica]